jgi:hypothetical protein
LQPNGHPTSPSLTAEFAGLLVLGRCSGSAEGRGMMQKTVSMSSSGRSMAVARTAAAQRHRQLIAPVCFQRSSAEQSSATTRVVVNRRASSAAPKLSRRSSLDALSIPQQQTPTEQEQELQLPKPLEQALGNYAAAWAAVPSRYKIVLAGSLSFVICNMVSAVVVSAVCTSCMKHRCILSMHNS